MDNELESFVEQVMEKQVYRNGIFSDWIDAVIQSMADFRASPDSRGMYGIRSDE
tara:strand:+ start:13759 stop:13920 length:162 start_codon:yes stop_codon:yes gene_type:complete